MDNIRVRFYVFLFELRVKITPDLQLVVHTL